MLHMIYFLLAIRVLLAPTDSMLNEPSQAICPCHIDSEEMEEAIEQMVEIATKNRAVGLAAPQIGISEWIIVVDMKAQGTENQTPDYKIYFDPEIIWRSNEMILGPEKCLSTSCICGIVLRSSRIIIRAYDHEANIFTEELSGYTARIFQHEVDHLNGIRFPDRIDNKAHLHWVEEDQRSAYLLNWSIWDQLYPKEQWEELKNSQ